MSLGVATEGEKRMHFKIIRFMMESAVKLHVKSVPLATAARIYHKFFSHNSTMVFDPYLVATTCLYLGGKIEEEHLKLRDVINVCYRCMYKEKPPLEIGSTYWALREAVSQCELLILRVLKFHVSFVHPHKFLLHYIKSVYDWLHPTIVERFPIARTAWAILRDTYHGSVCLRYDPEHLAVAILYMSLQCYGIEVPTSHDAECTWWGALVEDLRIERIRRICREIMDTYSLETNLPSAELLAETKSSSPVSQTSSVKKETTQKTHQEPPSRLPMDDVDDIDVFLYSDSHLQQPTQVQQPAMKEQKSQPPPKDSNAYFYSSLVSEERKVPSPAPSQQQDQQSLPGMGASRMMQEQQPPLEKKPIRITIPQGKANPAFGGMGTSSFGMAEQSSFSELSKPMISRSGNMGSNEDQSYFMGAKSPPKIEDEDDFDLLLFSRSESEPEKKEEKKNLFPILRY